MKIIDRKTAITLGLKKYYTGKMCRRGHISERYVAGACVACILEQKKAYYLAHKEKILKESILRGKLYRQANPEKRAANSRKWKQNNSKRVKELARLRYVKNSGRILATARKSYYKHRDKRLSYSQKWRKQNKGLVNYHTSKRKADLLMRTPKWLGIEELWLMKEAYKLAALRTKMFGFLWHVDHVIPLRGENVSGLHVPTNLQVIPAVENIRKKNSFVVA